MNPMISDWLLQAAVLFLLLGAVMGMLAGLVLLVQPGYLQRASAYLNRWISTRHLDRALERRIPLDPWFYRHRRLTGGAVLCGALYILYIFATQLDRVQAVSGLARRLATPPALAAELLDAVVLCALLGALGALVASLFILFRPSSMRGFETGANQWLSLRKTLKPLEIPRDGLEIYVAQHARQVGTLLLLGGLYTLLLLLRWLGR